MIYKSLKMINQFLLKKPMKIAVAMLLFSILLPGAYASSDQRGAIKGQVNFCGKGGLSGMMIYVPGKAITLVTDESGEFEFNDLPKGSYDLVYSHQGQVLNHNADIKVKAEKTTLLGEVRFCLQGATRNRPSAPSAPALSGSAGAKLVDNDGDGVPAGADCRDDDPKIRPGAIEICDGLDNDCDGQVDNLERTNINNGTASCDKGSLSIVSCDKGFADCDNDIKNGCEVNLMNDDQNCGACGNICTLEICSLGSC